MLSRFLTSSGGTVAIALLSGCAVVEPGIDAFQPSEPVAAMETYHSSGLQCLGTLVEESAVRPVDIYVESIPDRTVPRFFRQRGLSRGGDWWIRTAVNRLDTDRIRLLIDTDVGPTTRRGNADLLVFNGAWTQFDRRGADRGAAVQVNVGNVLFTLGGDQSYDLIAADFSTSVDGVVKHASGVGLVVASTTGDADLLIDNGESAGAIALTGANVEGAQMAQRHITEAAVMVHIADYYDLDFRPCLEAGWANPQLTRSLINDYKRMQPVQRAKEFQTLLRDLGYYTASIDGVWGRATSNALMAFESDNDMPLSGTPSVGTYVTLANARQAVSTE